MTINFLLIFVVRKDYYEKNSVYPDFLFGDIGRQRTRLPQPCVVRFLRWSVSLPCGRWLLYSQFNLSVFPRCPCLPQQGSDSLGAGGQLPHASFPAWPVRTLQSGEHRTGFDKRRRICGDYQKGACALIWSSTGFEIFVYGRKIVLKHDKVTIN